MTMADVLTAISLLIIIGLGFPALFVILTMLFPQPVAEASNLIGAHPLRTIARGAALFIIFLLVIGLIIAAHIGPFKLLGFWLLLFMLSLVMIGGAGFVNWLAARYSNFTVSLAPARNLIISALLVELAAVLPLVGWFVLTPALFCLMLGAGSEIAWRMIKQRAHSSKDLPAAAANIS